MQLDTIICADCFDVMAPIPDSSVNLIVSDWPYYKVKALDWDRQWKTVDEYLEWIGRVCAEYRRILAPNGSLYAFASPEMADKISVKVREFFDVLNHIVWPKGGDATHALKYGDDRFRQYVQKSERIIFAEHYRADSAAKGESGYGAKCDELRGFVFEPLRAYLDGERLRAGVSQRQVIARLGMAGHDPHFFKAAQWKLPLKHQYEAMRALFNRNNGHGHEYLRADYEDLRADYEDLRADYEDLRADYEDLRRPFSLTARDQYTDVWDFPTVRAYPGKHPCEKPPEMWGHIIRVSSRPGDVVGDFFCGSGRSLAAAMKMDRHYLGCDVSPHWVQKANENVEKARLEMSQLELPL